VLVLQVVRVLPDVDADHRYLAIGERAVLVRGTNDLQLAVIDNEPSPAGAELASCRLLELFLHLVDRAEGLVDRLGEVAGWRIGATGGHQHPEEAVVGMATTIVADGGPLRF